MFVTNAQFAQRHLSSFNPEGAINPHDVDQSGPGRFMDRGRFDPMKSSVQGGIFAGDVPDERPRGNVNAIQRVKSLPTGGGDFLDRLAAAESRDGAGIYSDRQNIYGERGAAGGRIGKDHERPSPAEGPNAAYSRAAKILNSHQTAADHYQQQQLSRQQAWLERQGGLSQHKDGRDGSEAAAGAKSRALQVREGYLGAQSNALHHSRQQQQQHAEALKRQEQQELMQQRAVAQQKMQQRAAIQQQQQMRHEQMQRQSAMALEQQKQQMYQHAQNDVAMKSQWARNRAAQRNGGSIHFG